MHHGFKGVPPFFLNFLLKFNNLLKFWENYKSNDGYFKAGNLSFKVTFQIKNNNQKISRNELECLFFKKKLNKFDKFQPIFYFIGFEN